MAQRYWLLLVLLCFVLSYGQKPAEIGLITDNDLYTSPINDQYYTAGHQLFYRYLGNPKSEKVAKKITEFRIGQYIYNPQSTNAGDINVNDRPFAGYLFAEAGINTFFKNESVLKASFQVGVLGPDAFVEEVQKGLHELIGYKKIRGWEYQITNTLGLQANFMYSKKIFANKFREKVDFHIMGQADLGTIWLGASVGPMMRISLKRNLLPVYESALYGAELNRDPQFYKNNRELFLYINPNINYQGYDATIQGSHFNDTSPVTYPLLHFRFNAEVGIKYRWNNWGFSYSFNYRGKELSNNVISGYYYGSIHLTYLLNH